MNRSRTPRAAAARQLQAEPSDVGPSEARADQQPVVDHGEAEHGGQRDHQGLGRPTSSKSLPPEDLPRLGRRLVLALRFSLDGFLHAVPPHLVRIPAQPCACESTPIARSAGEILVGRARYPVDDRKSLDSSSLHPWAPALLPPSIPSSPCPARRRECEV